MSDENNKASGVSEARAELARLTAAVNAPDIVAIANTLDEAIQACLQQIIDFRIEGPHDVYNHFALIGEVRGLRRQQVEIESKRNELLAQIDNAESKETTQLNELNNEE